MDLSRFTGTEKRDDKEKVVVDNDEMKVSLAGDDVIFFFKKEDAIRKYPNFLFFSPTNSMVSNNVEDFNDFFAEANKEGVEGLMIKSLSAAYKPGLRTGGMAKLKETKEDVDLVILAAEYGKGKRGGFYSSFFVGARNESSMEDEDVFMPVGKVSSGVKELGEEGISLAKLNELLLPLKTHEEKGITYFEPKVVIQVRYQEIQRSPTYSSGLALRFPRMISLREDKDIYEINTLEDLKRFS